MIKYILHHRINIIYGYISSIYRDGIVGDGAMDVVQREPLYYSSSGFELGCPESERVLMEREIALHQYTLSHL